MHHIIGDLRAKVVVVLKVLSRKNQDVPAPNRVKIEESNGVPALVDETR